MCTYAVSIVVSANFFLSLFGSMGDIAHNGDGDDIHAAEAGLSEERNATDWRLDCRQPKVCGKEAAEKTRHRRVSF